MMHFSEKKWEDVHHVCRKTAKSAADGAKKQHVSQFWHWKSSHIDFLYSPDIVPREANRKRMQIFKAVFRSHKTLS